MFYLADGKPIWFIGKIVTKDNEYKFATEEEKQEILAQIEGDYVIEKIPSPSPEILERAKKLEGKTLSKSEFERLLLNPTKEEILEQRISELELYILMKEGLI